MMWVLAILLLLVIFSLLTLIYATWKDYEAAQAFYAQFNEPFPDDIDYGDRDYCDEDDCEDEENSEED